MKPATKNNLKPLYIWDRPTRLFHWLLLPTFLVSLVTGLLDDIEIMEWHLLSGFALLGLLVFRVITGFFGHDFSRFDRLPLSLNQLLSYVQKKRSFTGHNPLGSWMIVIMLLALWVQVLSGFMTTDEIFVEGPWVALVEDSWVSWATITHGFNYWVLIALACLHIVAILLYRWLGGKNLLSPMLSGYDNDALIGSGHSATVMPVSKLLVIIIVSTVISLLLITVE